MKRILLLILGYYLVIQAGLGALAAFGQPENLIIIWAVSGLLGWGGYAILKKARSLKSVPDTRYIEPPDNFRPRLWTIPETQKPTYYRDDAEEAWRKMWDERPTKEKQ